MENKQKTICLCAIMRDEEKVLPRLIESCAPIIDYWVIVDTGSKDKSKEIIVDEMKKRKIPGELHEREWVDFGINRNQLLELSFAKADYLLLMDCDMTTHPTENFDKSKLHHDAYDIRYTGDLDFAQQLFVSGHKKWHYVGPTHEYITADHQYTLGDLRDLPVAHHFDGGTRSEKLERDRKLLETDILDNPGDARSSFYLAQTYNNLQLWEKAFKYYQQRVKIGGWEEEVYYSKYQCALMQMRMGKREEARILFLDAWEFRPVRVEALYMMGVLAREDKRYNQASMYLERAHNTPYPANDRLFIHRSISDYLIQFDLAIAYFYTGRIHDAQKLNDFVINHPGTAESIKTQAIDNQKHVHTKLGIGTDGSVKKDFLLVSFFTEDTEYKNEAAKLSETCNAHKVSHEIYQSKDAGSWEKNTQHKAVVIRDALEKHKKPILWVDADARVMKHPDMLHTVNIDVMYHYIKEWNEILAGTLYFDYNEKTIAFCKKWIELNSTNNNPDGINFQQLIIQDTTLSKGLFTKEYCSIFDNPHTRCDQPVIVHTQASRRNRGTKPKEVTQGYNSVISSLREAERNVVAGNYAIVGNGPFISDLDREIESSYVMRCNDFKVDNFKGIGHRTDLNISSLYKEIIPKAKVPYPILGILPITDTGYQKYTTAKEMHKFWDENATALKKMGNDVTLYGDQDRFYHEVFLPIAEGIQAFPTVGILAIGLARWWGAKNITITGFTFFESEKSHYYKDKNVKPSSHHNVGKEKLLLRSWIETDGIEYRLDGLTREALYDYKKQKWQAVSQPFEINWHKTSDDWRPKKEKWDKCKNNLLSANEYLKKILLKTGDALDVGCGPRSMLEFFPKWKKTMIEPLGEEYMKMYKYLNGDPLYCKPAEEFIPELEGKFGFIWCHNVLDHCYDWKLAVENIFRYIKPGGLFYIATDAGFPPNDGHPGIESTSVFMKELDRYNIEYHQKDIWEPEEEKKRRQIQGANHQIRSINLIGKYNVFDTDTTKQ